MNYTFNETDLDALGITDETTRSVLLKTTIHGDDFVSYDDFFSWGETLIKYKKYGIIQAKFTDSSYSSGTHFVGLRTSANSDMLKIAISDTTFICYCDAYSSMTEGGGSRNTCSSMTLSSCDTDMINSNLISIDIQGRCNIFDIVYDGFKTLTYGDKSIEIEVYDDTGITINGIKGVKHIIYNGVEVVNLIKNGVSVDIRPKITLSDGGVVDKPNSYVSKYALVEGTSYWAILKHISDNYYIVIYSPDPFGALVQTDSNIKIYTSSDNKRLSTGITGLRFHFDENGKQYFNKTFTGYYELTDTTWQFIACNHDIYKFTTTSNRTSTIQYAKTHD